MRGLQVTLFVLLMVVIATQTFRHVYVKWIEPKGSVLDEFRDPVEGDLAASRSLAELKEMYRTADAAVKRFEKDASLEDIERSQRTQREVYRHRDEIRSAIERWEDQGRRVFQLWFYWGCGLAGILLGLLAYARVNRWLGMVGIITGFVEMAVWTSPLWRAWGPQQEFERLLTWKLVLSFVSMALLVGLWLWHERRRGRTAVT
jgi:hypothetical protein